jgi:hypothetical protein
MRGYAKVAALMGRYPESAMFLQFSDMQIQSLLYQQAELFGLQQDLRELEGFNETNPEFSKYFTNWSALSTADQGTGGEKQWELVLLIREKLSQYSSTILSRESLFKIQN